MIKPSNVCKLSKSIALLSTSLIASSLLSSSVAFAQIDADTAAELRAQIAALASRLEELENENKEITSSIEETKASASADSWTNKIKISGDLRPRYEYVEDDNKSSNRNRSRVRARLAVTAQVNEDWTAGVGIATGGDDPISTNQTFGSGASTKDLRLDLAYVAYNGFENMTLLAGKYKNVFFKPGGQNLIYDGDYRPEGLALKYERNNIFFNAASMFLESDDKFNSQDKESMWGLQLGYEMALNEGTSLTFGSSYYEAAVAGSQPFYISTKPYGNTVDDAGRYIHNYEELEFFTEAKMSLAGQPLTLFADYVTNLDADEFDTGWSLGATFGKASSAGAWEFGYSYQDLEADAVLGSLTDSDFGGSGTDTVGHLLNATYGLGKNSTLGLTYFINEYGEARFGEKVGYNRMHLALQVKF